MPPFTLVTKADGDHHDNIPRFLVFVIPLLSFAQRICLQFIHFPLVFFFRLQRALWTRTGALNLIHRRLELDRAIPQFPRPFPLHRHPLPLACLLDRRS